MTDQPLKPCPFCGSDDIYSAGYAYQCKCSAEAGSHVWQQRSIEDRLRSDLDVAVEALESVAYGGSNDVLFKRRKAIETLTKIRGDK